MLDYEAIGKFLEQLEQVTADIHTCTDRMNQLKKGRDQVVCELLALGTPHREIAAAARIALHTVGAIRDRQCPQTKIAERPRRL